MPAQARPDPAGDRLRTGIAGIKARVDDLQVNKRKAVGVRRKGTGVTTGSSYHVVECNTAPAAVRDSSSGAYPALVALTLPKHTNALPIANVCPV